MQSSTGPKIVLNFGNKSLGNRVLSLGLNFTIAPKTVPKEDIIARTEQIAGMMKEEGQKLREEVGRCLDNFQGSKPTLKKAEREAIKSLRMIMIFS